MKATLLRRDDILGYIINSYAGLEESPSRPGVFRRVFLWEDAGDILMGNTEAFTQHLGRRFPELEVQGSSPALVHALLRELGEPAARHRPHASPSPTSPKAGRFRQPDPDQWIVGFARKEAE